MTDYQELYKQSQVQIQKLKDQVKKLEDQIRQRCQSYLIHSSRYRSKNSTGKKPQQGAPTEENPSNLKIDRRSVHISIEATPNANQQNEEILAYQTPIQPSKFQTGSQKKEENFKDNGKISSLSNNTQNTKLMNKENSLYTQKQDLSQKQQALNSTSNVFQSSLLKSQSQAPNSAQQIQTQAIKWEEILAGFKQRLSQSQKQKSQLSQRVMELEQSLKKCKRQMRASLDASTSAMKKKPTQTEFVQGSENSNSNKADTQVTPPSNISVNLFKKDSSKSNENMSAIEQQLSGLWDIVKGDIDFSNCRTLQDKINELIKFISQNKRILKQYQQNIKLQESKVEQYSYSTPYRKFKSKESNQDNNQLRDVYEQNQVELLKRKCRQLQMQLSQSRAEKVQTPATPAEKLQNNIQTNENGLIEEAHQEETEQINDPPYLIQEELEKPTDPYIKRSFVRKKVVKRNLSVMLMRTPSKSKHQSKQAMAAQLQKLQNHLQKTKDGKNDKEIMSLSKKIQKLERNLQAKQNQIDEVSDDNSSIARASGVSDQGFTEIIQVQTQGPGFKNYTAHILGLKKKQKSNHESKEKRNRLDY